MALTFKYPCTSQIKCSRSMASIYLDILSMPPHETLVIFDIDNVVLKSQDKILDFHQNREYIKNKINDLISQKYPLLIDPLERKSLFQFYIGTILAQRKPALVENDTPYFIDSLQKKKFRVIALTMIDTGAFPGIGCIEQWRDQELKSLGIDFSKAFPRLDYEHLGLDLKQHRHGYPKFRSGILFAAGYNKGKILEAFLNRVSFKPKQIVFIDDKKENLTAIQSYCQQHALAFKGYHYTKANNPAPLLTEDLAIAEQQFSYFAEYGIWNHQAFFKLPSQPIKTQPH